MTLMTLQFSEAVMLGCMGKELSAFEQEPLAVAVDAVGIIVSSSAEVVAPAVWPWLTRKDLELHCCERELSYGPMAYCRLEHLWDAHVVMPQDGAMKLSLDEYCAVIASIEPVVPWRSREEHIAWLQEEVKEELSKEREHKE